MGFGTAGAAAIVAAAALVAGAIFGQAALGLVEDVEESRRDAFERGGEKSRTEMTIAEVKRIGPSVYVIADNDGSSVLDPNDLDVLFDGVLRTVDIINWTANAKENTAVWPPGTRLHVRVDEGTVPSRASLVAGNGVAAYWGS